MFYSSLAKEIAIVHKQEAYRLERERCYGVVIVGRLHNWGAASCRATSRSVDQFAKFFIGTLSTNL